MLRERCPKARLVGVQAGKTAQGTIADGIAVKQPGELTMSILEDLLDEIVHVEDEEIAEAITLLLERAKLVVEGAGAASLATLLSGKAGGTGSACALLSGGNIDPTLLISVMQHGLTLAGRYLVLRTHIADRPGALVELLELVADERGNVVSVEHHREGMTSPRRGNGGRADRGHARRESLRRSVCCARTARLRAPAASVAAGALRFVRSALDELRATRRSA